MDSTAATSASEQNLLLQAQAGDHRAFAELVARHDDRLRALARRVLRDPDRVDDALQEAYLKAFRGLGRFRADCSVATWLYRITYNACLDELRRRPVLVTSDAQVDVACPATGPAEAAVAKLEAAAVLARLGPEIRATVVLVHGLGFDYEDAASALNVPIGTIASRLNRVRSRARQGVGAHAA
jgi:RNA polymerase sigma-70 factor (ECF subfamily)